MLKLNQLERTKMLNLNTLKQMSITAMKEKDELKKSVLSVLLSNIDNEGSLRNLSMNVDLDDETRAKKESEIILKSISQMVASMDKNLEKMKEEMAENQIANNNSKIDDFIKRLESEKAVLRALLPQKLSNDELKAIIEKCIIDNNLDMTKKPSIGIINKFLRENHLGQFDGKTANALINEYLK